MRAAGFKPVEDSLQWNLQAVPDQATKHSGSDQATRPPALATSGAKLSGSQRDTSAGSARLLPNQASSLPEQDASTSNEDAWDSLQSPPDAGPIGRDEFEVCCFTIGWSHPSVLPPPFLYPPSLSSPPFFFSFLRSFSFLLTVFPFQDRLPGLLVLRSFDVASGNKHKKVGVKRPHWGSYNSAPASFSNGHARKRT
jgi:hypothetical protein